VWTSKTCTTTKIKLKIVFHSKTSRIPQQLIKKNINPNINVGGKKTFSNTYKSRV
jgi:hypothetical protein